MRDRAAMIDPSDARFASSRAPSRTAKPLDASGTGKASSPR